MSVGTAGLELIAQGGLGHEDVNPDGNQNGNEDAGIDLGTGENFIQTQLGGLYAAAVHIGPGPIHHGPAIGGLIDIAALGILHRVLEHFIRVKEPGHQIGCNPVCHNTGQHFVDVEQGLYKAGDAAPQRPGQHAAQKGQQPDNRAGQRGDRNTQGDGQGNHGPHQILPRRTDVEQARLERHRHGQSGEDQRGCTEEHVADALGVEAPGEAARRVPSGAEDAEKDKPDAFPGACHAQVVAEQAHHQHQNAAHRQTDDNGKQGCQHSLCPILLQQSSTLVLHAPSSPSPV